MLEDIKIIKNIANLKGYYDEDIIFYKPFAHQFCFLAFVGNIFGENTANLSSIAATESSAHITALDSTYDSFFLPELLYYYRITKS